MISLKDLFNEQITSANRNLDTLFEKKYKGNYDFSVDSKLKEIYKFIDENEINDISDEKLNIIIEPFRTDVKAMGNINKFINSNNIILNLKNKFSNVYDNDLMSLKKIFPKYVLLRAEVERDNSLSLYLINRFKIAGTREKSKYVVIFPDLSLRVFENLETLQKTTEEEYTKVTVYNKNHNFIYSDIIENNRYINIFKDNNGYNLDNLISSYNISKTPESFSNLINHIYYLQYYKKEFYLDKHFSRGDEVIFSKKSNIFTILSYINDYEDMVRLLNKAMDIESFLVKNTFMVNIYKIYKINEIVNISLYNNKFNEGIFKLLKKTYKGEINFNQQLKEELSELIDFFNNISEYFDKEQAIIILFSCFYFSIKENNLLDKLHSFSVTNSNIPNYNDLNLNILPARPSYIQQKLYGIHLATKKSDEQITNNIKKNRMDFHKNLSTYTIYSRILGKYLCSEVALFYLLNNIIIDFNNMTWNRVVIERIKIPNIKNFFEKYQPNNIIERVKNRNIMELFNEFHLLWKEIYENLSSPHSVLEPTNKNKILRGIIKTDDIGRFQELPAYGYVIALMIDRIFGLNMIINEDGSYKVDKTNQIFIDMLKEINPTLNIKLLGFTISTNPILEENVRNSIHLTFDDDLIIYFNPGHGDIEKRNNERIDNMYEINRLYRGITNKLKSNFIISLNIEEKKYYPLEDKSTSNLLFYKKVIEEVDLSRILTDSHSERFITEAKSVEDYYKRIQYLTVNLENYFDFDMIPSDFKLMFDEDIISGSYEDVSVDFFKDSIDTSSIISIFKNKMDRTDILFNRDILNQYRKQKNTLSDIELFGEIIKETITSLVNSEFINEIFSKNPEFKVKFLTFVIRNINDAISKTVKEFNTENGKSYDDDIIILSLKGGVNFYSLLEKFTREMEQINPRFVNKIKDMIKIKRSDFDFSINIDPTLPKEEFYKLYLSINKKISQICIHLKNILNKLIFINIDINSIVYKIRDAIIKEVEFEKESIKKDILQLNNITLMYNIGNKVKKSQPNTINIDYGFEANSLVPDTTIYPPLKRNPHLNNMELPLHKKDFYITYSELKDTDPLDPYNTYLTDKHNPLLKDIPSEASNIYYYANETNLFRANGESTSINNFLLHRLKMNSKVYLSNGEYIYYCPIGIEILDIAIPTMEDTYHKNYYNKSKISLYNFNDLSVNMYNLDGLIFDYIKMFFLESQYPWEVSKKEKRLMRFVVILMMKNIYDNSIDSIETNLLKKLNRITPREYVFNIHDNPYNNIIGLLANIKKNIGDDEILNNKYKKFVKTFKDQLIELVNVAKGSSIIKEGIMIEDIDNVKLSLKLVVDKDGVNLIKQTIPIVNKFKDTYKQIIDNTDINNLKDYLQRNNRFLNNKFNKFKREKITILGKMGDLLKHLNKNKIKDIYNSLDVIITEYNNITEFLTTPSDDIEVLERIEIIYNVKTSIDNIVVNNTLITNKLFVDNTEEKGFIDNMKIIIDTNLGIMSNNFSVDVKQYINKLVQIRKSIEERNIVETLDNFRMLNNMLSKQNLKDMIEAKELDGDNVTKIINLLNQIKPNMRLDKIKEDKSINYLKKYKFKFINI